MGMGRGGGGYVQCETSEAAWGKGRGRDWNGGWWQRVEGSCMGALFWGSSASCPALCAEPQYSRSRAVDPTSQDLLPVAPQSDSPAPGPSATMLARPGSGGAEVLIDVPCPMSHPETPALPLAPNTAAHYRTSYTGFSILWSFFLFFFLFSPFFPFFFFQKQLFWTMGGHPGEGGASRQEIFAMGYFEAGLFRMQS